MSISATQVKDLREKTGAGMMDCKKALTETNGDFEAAVDWLRTKGLAAAAKKAGRVASEGLVAVLTGDKKAALVEINSETDFVARNDKFQALVNSIATIALEAKDLETLKAMKHPSGKTVGEEVIENIATIGENLTLRRSDLVTVENGVVSTYVHNAVAPNLGKIGIAVALESTTSNTEKLAAFGKSLAMHIAASRPLVLTEAEVSADLLTRERDIAAEKAKASGKPDNIIQGMVEGRIRKFYEEIVLLNQIYVIDGKTKISDLLANLAKEIGSDVKIASFTRFELGEGVEKEESNFAAEVAAVAGK
jgi:elongation factor Ts